MDGWAFQWVQRGSKLYEESRRKAVWNGFVPDRFPDIIAYPENDRQVQEIVNFAKNTGMKIGVKSGGHSWSASFLRNGGVLIDLVKMNHYSFDAEAKTAEVQPAAYASQLNDLILDHNLMFPGGHCPTVGMGGFLLQGGFGWNSGNWGMACESVLALDLVTADGELVHASPLQNSEYYWAARGAGCGFFAVVTRFYLQLHTLPPGIMTARYVFDVAELEEVLVAIDDVSGRMSRDLEVCMFVANEQDGFVGKPTVAITMDAFSDTIDQAREAIALIHNLPVFRKAIASHEFIQCTLRQMMQRLDDLLDNRGLHYAVDNMWANVSIQKLVPSFHKIIELLPAPPAHLYLTWWHRETRPDMAFSMEHRLYVAMYVISTESTHDTAHANYVRESFSLMSKHEEGIQLADENLPSHPGKFMATSNFAALSKLRKRLDPHRRFHDYFRVPGEFAELMRTL